MDMKDSREEQTRVMTGQEEGGFAEEQMEMQKSSGGFAKGLLVGFLAAVLVIGAGANIYCRLADSRLVIGKSHAGEVKNSRVLDQKAVDKITEITANMDLYYYEKFSKKDIKNGIYAGVLAGLGDPYSVYYTPEQFADQQVSTKGIYCGIGAGLSQDPATKKVVVTRIYSGTPSEAAGMKKDDVILKVEEVAATSMELSELVKKIRGEEGTKVHIQLYRPSEARTMELDVERKNIQLPSVESRLLDGGIAYIQVTEFQENTAKQFEDQIKDLEKKGMRSMIVDLRDNPGGMLSAVVEMLDVILPKGLVVYTQDKYGQKQEYSSDASCLKYPLAVLINENSASASEIFAGAIKDYHYGTLIGTKSFGKGIVQTILPLKDGDAMKITTSKYFTPKGNYIHGKGIEPDIQLEYKFGGGEKDQYDIKYDNQIQKAIEVLGHEK